MTLCLAAVCTFKRQNRIIIASDFQTENESIGAEIQIKAASIGDRHVALLAGTSSRATEFTYVCEEFFDTEVGEELDTHDKLRQVVKIQKHRLADEYIAGQLGIHYDAFLATGAQQLPSDLFREMTYSITNITLGCSLIVVTFAEGIPRLFRVHESGMVEICDNFCAVGSGMYIAESQMFLREHHEELPLKDALYDVYEAMRLGARAPGVGERFTISILSDNGDETIKWEYITAEYERYLEQAFKRFAPRTASGLKYHPEFVKINRG